MILNEYFYNKLHNKKCGLEQCLKYNLDDMLFLSEKYIAWTKDIVIDELEPLGPTKFGISTNNDIYFYDKNNFALCLKNNKLIEFYRNYNTIINSVNIINYIMKKLNANQQINLCKFLSIIKDPHYIANYWSVKDNIFDLHIIPTINGMKHIQINLAANPITISFYFKGQDVVINNNNLKSLFIVQNLNKNFDKNDTNSVEYDKLYEDLNISIWKTILGKGLHYHCGDFSKFNDYRAFQESIKYLYQFIGFNKKILDIGCGWGGPAQLLRSDLNSNITCVTPSVQQLEYVENMGFDVYHGYIENIRLYSYYDIALCIESFSHFNKNRFLKKIKNYCNTLVMLVNCSSKYSVLKDFKMEVLTPELLKNILIENGWNIIHFENRRKDNKSNYYWNNRIPKNIDSYHLNQLNLHNYKSIILDKEWIENNPVMLVVANKNNNYNIPMCDLSLINKSDFEYNQLFKKLGIDVIVEDNNECILENMKKILLYFNSNCLKKIHPLSYGNTNTYGKMLINEHPKCINDYINKYKIKDNNDYLVSFNRSESKFDNIDENTFIKSHTDEFNGKKSLKTTISYILSSYPFGGDFFVVHNNEKIFIPCKIGRTINFSGDVEYGAMPFCKKSRMTISFAQF